MTNPCECVQFLSGALDSRLQIYIVYTDISKAFDTVDVDILLRKLDGIGPCHSFVQLFGSILQVEDNLLSTEINVKSAFLDNGLFRTNAF